MVSKKASKMRLPTLSRYKLQEREEDHRLRLSEAVPNGLNTLAINYHNILCRNRELLKYDQIVFLVLHYPFRSDSSTCHDDLQG
ncbi:hypothetical protein BDR07DRAFT_1464375 [Suillus spraguei]|nr:hypothetical protein BDR07DRAFT_1464375 [Suillus spraguei]